ncbi:MAG: tetratricopeptide repeat protein [Treponema sp.]|nr:tetratricopeptide repeat protein [Treponema sp.]
MRQGRLVYLTVPPELHKKFRGLLHEHGQDHFSFDPSIPLPVELPQDETDFRPEKLSPETILSGILRELSQLPEHDEHSVYYRELVLALRPGILEELTEAAVLKAGNGDYDTALEIFDILSGLFPRRSEENAARVILLNRALVLEAKAQASGKTQATPETSGVSSGFAAAEFAWEDALASPVNDTIFFAGLFYFKQEEYGRAAELFALYLEENEFRGDSSLPEADGEDETKDEVEEVDEEKVKTARKLLDEIRNDSLDDPSFREACGLMRKGDEENAILKAREFLEKNPRAGKGWFMLGWGLRRLSRFKDGETCFEKAVELGLDNADTRNELAICRMETGNYDGARNELEKALRLDPDNVKIISNMGMLALKQGRTDEAAAFFRTALELDGEDPIAKAWAGARHE